MSDYPSSLTSIFKNMCASVNNIRMTSPKVMRSVHDNTWHCVTMRGNLWLMSSCVLVERMWLMCTREWWDLFVTMRQNSWLMCTCEYHNGTHACHRNVNQMSPKIYPIVAVVLKDLTHRRHELVELQMFLMTKLRSDSNKLTRWHLGYILMTMWHMKPLAEIPNITHACHGNVIQMSPNVTN